MTPAEIFQKLKEEFGDSVIELVDTPPSDAFIWINPEKLFDIMHFLRDHNDLQFDYLTLLSGMDWKDSFGVVYHLYSFVFKHRIVIKVKLERDNPRVASVERLWRTADWHEREAYDMFGIIFEGHHNLIRILCPYDWEGYPLRKDYTQPDEYHGIKVPY